MRIIILFLCFCSQSYAASGIDNFLRQKIEFFQIKPIVQSAKNPNSSQVELGKRLFMETDLSGNRNISCLTCHDPMKGTSDHLPLSQTQDGNGVLKRNSPGLFNIGNHSTMFWDGRVQYDNLNKIFTTPELNLPPEISKVMTSALAAQALFPIVSNAEMRGNVGENEIANANSNIEAWAKVVTRLKNQRSDSPRFKTYNQLFKEAYPETDLEKINIGHIAEAIASFEKEQFQSTGSPFNRYLSGDNNALTEKQKRGFAIFVDRGMCIACHQGSELGNSSFFTSVGVPSWGAEPVGQDIGRGEIKNESFKKYFFKTPSLLNVGLTAPYMHNGAFQTIKEVINHYSNIRSSLFNYEIPLDRKNSMPVPISLEKKPEILNEIFNSIQAPFLKRGLNFSEEEKSDLEAFLAEGLTDPSWNPSSHF